VASRHSEISIQKCKQIQIKFIDSIIWMNFTFYWSKFRSRLLYNKYCTSNHIKFKHYLIVFKILLEYCNLVNHNYEANLTKIMERISIKFRPVIMFSRDFWCVLTYIVYQKLSYSWYFRNYMCIFVSML
jgi:hypothetical protein